MTDDEFRSRVLRQMVNAPGTLMEDFALATRTDDFWGAYLALLTFEAFEEYQCRLNES